LSDKHYRFSDNVFWRLYNDGVIAIHHGTNEIILLNSTGAAIWLFLNFPRTIEEIATFLKSRFEIGFKNALKDAHEFISSLFYRGFIEVQGETEDLNRERRNQGNKNYSAEHVVTGWAAGKLIPLSVQIELTHGCNLRCAHCYLSDHYMNAIDLPSFKKILQQLKDAGTLFLTLTGGEVLLYPDLIGILDTAVLQYGFSTTIYTNGTIRRKDWKDIITRYSLREIHVSLYSLRSHIHDEITGVKGSHGLTIGFIRELIDRGVRVVIKSPLFRQTIEEANFLRRYAKEMGAEWMGGPMITPQDNGNMAPIAMRANHEQIISYFQGLEEKSLLVKGDISRDSKIEKPLACLALSNSCFIDTHGDLYPCSQIREKIGNILETPFEKLWYESPILKRLREINLDHLRECADCNLLPYCSRCPGLADLEGKDILGPSPFDCVLAQCRKEAEKS